ncbi:unnamed protein product [Phytophthora fragariaefolia]|uniref:Unnamed protein product n=1 Tax=Phytophthora fragariaefolia TaxID=1490495 RepID=A0A9W6U479_9STRA|nr:unnamed protein product [Phytophthora fragariaefolia]
MTRMSYKKPVTRRAAGPFQKLVSDMCYVGEGTYHGFEHFQLVQDEASRYLWGFMMHRKEEASEVVLAHVKWVLAQGHKVEVFSSDQGPELFNKLKFYLEANGIEYTTTNAYSPEENGLVEKMNGVVMSRVRCLLTAAHMPWSLWGEAFNFAIQVMTISGSSALGGETPYYRRFSERPEVSMLRTWGCVAFIFTPKVLRKSELENPGKPGLFVGYAKHSESFRILNLLSGKLNEVRSLEFEEEWTVEASYVEKLLSNRYGNGRTNNLRSFRTEPTPPVASGAPRRWSVSEIEVPVASTSAVATPPTPEGVLQLGGNAPQFEDSYRESGDNGAADSPNSSRMQTAGPPLDRGVSRSVGDQDSYDAAGNEAAEGDVEMDDANASFGDPADLLGRFTTYEGFIDDDSEDEDDDEADGWRDEASRAATSFRRSTRIRRPNVRLQDYEIEIPASLVIEAVNVLMEPQTVDEALQGPDAEKWIDALEKEYYDLMRNNAWVLVERPNGKKILGSKWVFVRKRNHKGEGVRHRARITIKGCQQEYGVNFWDTHAPVVSHESVRLVLLLALHYGLPCEHVDFVTAFLNGPIGDDVEIYMEMPDYFNDGSGRVCRLLRSLYGLKQAQLIWNKMLDEPLRSCGFKRSKMDNGVYWRVVGTSSIFLTVYVDDVIIAANAENIKLVVGELEWKFSITDLGSVSWLLGMEIKYIPGQAMWISQRGQIEKILKRFQMAKCRAVATPQTLGPLPLPATLDDEDVNDPNVPYRAIVGCLQYLVQCTRPDLANAVRALDKYLNKKESPDLHFVAYADADLGNEKDDRHSITGYVLQLNGCTYACISRKQRIVTDDTCCAEFVAASECSTMIVWTHNLCKELTLTRYHPTVLYQDNQATITVVTEIKGNYNTKSVDLQYHKVRDFHERGEFEVRYCPSNENLADIFTKALGPTLFRTFRQRLNVMALPTAIDNGNADGSD